MAPGTESPLQPALPESVWEYALASGVVSLVVLVVLLVVFLRRRPH